MFYFLIFVVVCLFVSAPSKCKDIALDLAIVLEASTELGEAHFLHGREFIKQFLNLIDISQAKTHVSILLFNSQLHRIISFDQAIYQSNEAVNAVLQFLTPSLQPGKRLDRALKYLNSTVFTEERGDRPNVRNVAAIVTNGFVDKGYEKDLFYAI